MEVKFTSAELFFRPIIFRLCLFCRCGFVIVVIFPGRGVGGVGNNVSAGAGVDRG